MTNASYATRRSRPTQSGDRSIGRASTRWGVVASLFCLLVAGLVAVGTFRPPPPTESPRPPTTLEPSRTTATHADESPALRAAGRTVVEPPDSREHRTWRVTVRSLDGSKLPAEALLSVVVRRGDATAFNVRIDGPTAEIPQVEWGDVVQVVRNFPDFSFGFENLSSEAVVTDWMSRTVTVSIGGWRPVRITPPFADAFSAYDFSFRLNLSNGRKIGFDLRRGARPAFPLPSDASVVDGEWFRSTGSISDGGSVRMSADQRSVECSLHAEGGR